MTPKEDRIRSVIQSLWDDSSTKDFEIICGREATKRSVFCHRPILAIASPFIRNLIKDGNFQIS